MSLLLFQLYYIRAWKSWGRVGDSASDLLPEGGDTVIEDPEDACQLLLLFMPHPPSRVSPPSHFLSLPLSTLLVSLASFSLLCATVPSLSLPFPPFFPDPLILLTLSFVQNTHSNIESLPALWKLRLSPSFGSPEGREKRKKKVKGGFLRPNKSRAQQFLLYLGLLRASVPLSRFSLRINLSLLSRMTRGCRWCHVDKRKRRYVEGASHFLCYSLTPGFCSEPESFCSAALHAAPLFQIRLYSNEWQINCRFYQSLNQFYSSDHSSTVGCHGWNLKRTEPK